MKQFFTIIISLFIFTLAVLPIKQAKAEDDKVIIVTGQVTTINHGNPLVGHKVYVKNDSLNTGQLEYYKELTTDEYGYYYDTITTTYMHGSIVVYTFDYDHILTFANVHFRFLTEGNDNIFINDFNVFMPFMTPHLQARFSHEQDTINNRFEFAFFDKTDNNQILERIWDFGDSKSSNEKDPVHVFSEPGFYRVNLTVTAVVDNRTETNTITKFIFIPVYTYFDLGGNCFSGLFPIQEGTAFLYSMDSNNLVWPMDTANINNLGIYYFYQIPIGKYTIKVQPKKNSAQYGEMMPTYFGDQLFWQNATFFMHEAKNYDYDVYLQPGMGTAAGEGSISGVVTMEEVMLNNLVTSTKNVDVYLFNTDYETLASHYTDDNSEFLFENIAYGTYYIAPEITGIPRNETRIIISEDIPEMSSITINAETGEVSLGLIETHSLGTVEVSEPYPNPSSYQVSLRVNAEQSGEAIIEVIDLHGRLVKSMTSRLNSGANTISMSTESLDNGIYFIRMQIDKMFTESKFIVSK